MCAAWHIAELPAAVDRDADGAAADETLAALLVGVSNRGSLADPDAVLPRWTPPVSWSAWSCDTVRSPNVDVAPTTQKAGAFVNWRSLPYIRTRAARQHRKPGQFALDVLADDMGVHLRAPLWRRPARATALGIRDAANTLPVPTSRPPGRPNLKLVRRDSTGWRMFDEGRLRGEPYLVGARTPGRLSPDTAAEIGAPPMARRSRSARQRLNPLSRAVSPTCPTASCGFR